MSNHYYEEKPAYRQALNDTRGQAHDLMPFLRFALSGVERQCRRLFDEMRFHVAKASTETPLPTSLDASSHRASE